MPLQIKGGKAGSVSRLKSQIESRGRTWIRGLREGEDLTVRFLTEPDEWYAYREHFSPEVNFFPCIGDECPGCDADSEQVQRASRRFLANALDTGSGEVIPLKLPLDLANRLVARYERNGNTITDRDYTLHRMGKRLDTTYDVTPEDPSRVDASRYQLIELEDALLHQFKEAFGLGEGEDVSSAGGLSGGQSSGGPPADTDQGLDTDDGAGTADDDVPSEPSPATDGVRGGTTDTAPAEGAGGDEDDEDYLTEEEALKMTRSELKSLADECGVAIKSTWNKQQIVDAIFEAAGE